MRYEWLKTPVSGVLDAVLGLVALWVFLGIMALLVLGAWIIVISTVVFIIGLVI